MTRRWKSTAMSVALVATIAGCTGGSDATPSDTASETSSVDPNATSVATTDARSGAGGEPTRQATLPEGDQPASLGPLGGTVVEIATDDGNVQIGAGDVPEPIPASFPRPDDLTVNLSTAEGEQAGFSASSSLGFDQLVELYRSGLADAGYAADEVHVVEGEIAVFEFDGPDGTGRVAISATPGGPGHDVLVTFSS